MNWIHLLEWLNVSITVRREREKCHLGYFRKQNLSATLSFAFQFVEAAVLKCNRTSIEYEFTLDTHTHTHTHTMTTKATFFIVFSHSFKKFITMTVLILLTWKFAVVVCNVWWLWKCYGGPRGGKVGCMGTKMKSHAPRRYVNTTYTPNPQPPPNALSTTFIKTARRPYIPNLPGSPV